MQRFTSMRTSPCPFLLCSNQNCSIFSSVEDVFRWFKKKLGLKTADDWYKVRYEDIVRCGGAALLKSYAIRISIFSTNSHYFKTL